MGNNLELKEVLKNIPLRIAITPHCNLNCFFCSNEGMNLKLKNTEQADLKDLLYLLRLLREKGLERISITGGDPVCYPQLEELLAWINNLGFKEKFVHTNGTGLNNRLIKGALKEFSKIAVSIHSLDFSEWKKMTGGNEVQFRKMIENLQLLSKEGYGSKIEIKVVPIKGFNYSKKSILEILEFCNKNSFRFKFLILEPIKAEHIPLVINLEEVDSLLLSLNAEKLPKEDNFRNQKEYLPINRFKYKSTEGVLIEIGCGNKEVCKSCFGSNEIFLTPSLQIKPCHINPYVISLKEAIQKKEDELILKTILESRVFLKASPGENKQYWSQE